MKKYLLITLISLGISIYAINCRASGITFPSNPRQISNIAPINIKDSPIGIVKIDLKEGYCCQITLENKGENEIDNAILKGLILSKDEKIIGGFAKLIALNLSKKAQQEIFIDWNKIMRDNVNNEIILFPFKIFFKTYNEKGELINNIAYWQLRKELIKNVALKKEANLLGETKSIEEAGAEPQKTNCEFCRDAAMADCGNPWRNGCISWAACTLHFECRDGAEGYCYYTCKPPEQCC